MEKYQAKEEFNKELFEKYFPGAKMEESNLNELTPEQMSVIEKTIKEEFRGEAYSIEYDKIEEKTYVVTVNDNEFTPGFVFFDFGVTGDYQGGGLFRYSLQDNYSFVSNTQTNEGYRGLGLGTRRLRLMNAFSVSDGKGPLYSGDFRNEAPAHMWESLQKKGEVEVIKNANDPMKREYRFKEKINE